uniref:Uncharacterized protein n=1 Tax=Panagrolaimus davidi TaxID=227884 RepID=A0A914QAJ4_9BILA
MEKRQKEYADTILILQNEKKTLKAEVEDATRALQKSNEALKNEQKLKNEMAAKILECQTQITRLKETVAEQKEQINVMEKIQKEASELLIIDPTQTCNLADVIVNNKIAYERLNGKVLLVDDLQYSDGKWSVWSKVHKYPISFEHSDFKIFPQFEFDVTNNQNLSSVLNRIVCSNLKDLYLFKITIPFCDYKKLTGNKISCLYLYDLIVYDEYGIKVKIDKLWKEIKNVKSLTHKFTDNESMHEIAQKLAELAPFPNLKWLYLENVQDGFDLQAFYQFLIKNTKVACTIKCSGESLKQMKKARKEMPKLPKGHYFHIVEYK